MLKSFIYIFQRQKWQSKQDGWHLGCYVPLSYAHTLYSKGIFFVTVIVENETSILSLVHLLGVV